MTTAAANIDPKIDPKTDPKRRALGKGLDSLLPRAQAPAAPATESEGGRPREISLDLIDHNPFQTRSQINQDQLSELAASIVANGVVQPILVRPLASGRFQLIAGERRWRASQIAGKTTVPAILRQVSDEQAMEITIVENLQRADLNPMEQARAFERLSREFHMTQEQMAQRTGKDRAAVRAGPGRVRRAFIRPRSRSACTLRHRGDGKGGTANCRQFAFCSPNRKPRPRTHRPKPKGEKEP